MMTREEALEVLKGLRRRTVSYLWPREVDKFDAAIAALSREPIAEVKTKAKPIPTESQWYTVTVQFNAGTERPTFPVRVLIFDDSEEIGR